jgi:hypothetical protein
MMVRPGAFWLVVAALLAAPADAQVVLGHIVEDGSGNPIGTAGVELLDRRGNVVSRAVSDSAGHFLLKATQGGNYRLRATALGYQTVTTPGITVDIAEQFQVRVVMSPDAVLLAPLEIRARSRPLLSGMTLQGYQERREKGLGFAITAEDIEERHGRAVTDMLRMVPGVRVEWVFGGSRVSIPSAATRLGSRSCEVKVFLDGLQFAWGSSTLDDIPTYDIHAIEVFRSLAELPPELAGPDSECGVIAVWTKRGTD